VDCPDGSIDVCFKRGVRNCPIEVYTTSNYVVKDGKRMYYEGNALMYAAIFSNKEDYECQLDRLMGRAEQLYKIYAEKSRFVFQKTGCDSEMEADLIVMGNMMKNFQGSDSLSQIYSLADDVNKENENAECRLW
jgi:spore maturation protein CgeB